MLTCIQLLQLNLNLLTVNQELSYKHNIIIMTER